MSMNSWLGTAAFSWLQTNGISEARSEQNVDLLDNHSLYEVLRSRLQSNPPPVPPAGPTGKLSLERDRSVKSESRRHNRWYHARIKNGIVYKYSIDENERGWTKSRRVEEKRKKRRRGPAEMQTTLLGHSPLHVTANIFISYTSILLHSSTTSTSISHLTPNCSSLSLFSAPELSLFLPLFLLPRLRTFSLPPLRDRPPA